MPYCYRDIDGDLLYFVHRGSGVFATEFGPLLYEPGDYVLIPKGTTFRLMPDDQDSLLLVVEAPQPIRLCEHEQVGRHTPVDPTVLRVPDVADYGWPKQDEYEVRIKHAGGHSSIFYRNDPMKVVGWNAKLLRDQGGNNTEYYTNSITLGGGESLDVILDASDDSCSAYAGGGCSAKLYPAGSTFYLYTPQLDHLSNDAENFGGMMTEVHICSSVTGPAPNPTTQYPNPPGSTFGNTCN